MRKKTKSFALTLTTRVRAAMLLIAMLCCATGAWADELTVYDGSDQTSTVPFNGLYADYGTRSQFIIPAEDLSEMAGGSISKLTFYANVESASFDQEVTVYLKEVDYSTFGTATLENWDDMTAVYTGNIAVSGNTMEIVFDTPFAYGTDNLMIGLQVTNWGSECPSLKWYGENQPEGYYTAVYNNANSSHTWSTSLTRITFIPKTTFTYTGGGSVVVVEKPQTFEASSITSSGAVLTWTGGTGTYNLEYRKAADEEWTVALANTTAQTYTFTGLESNTKYQARVQSVSGSDVSGWKTLSFTTAIGYPYIEDFTAGLPSIWTRYTGLLEDILNNTESLVSATSGWSVGTNNSVLDGNHAYANIYSTGCQKWLVTPTIIIPANAQLAFDVAYTTYGGTAADPAQDGTDDKFVVLISTDGMATWTILRQWDNAGSTFVLNNLTPAGENVAIALGDYAGQSVNVAFYCESTVSNADNNIHIDNVAFQEKPACEKPVGLSVNYTGGTEATVSWISEEPNFDIDVNGTITENVGNPYTLTGLEYATTYTVKVRAKNGNGESDWTNPVSFTTDLSDNMCSITLVLTDGYGDGWNGNAIKIVDVLTGIEIGTYANQNLDGKTGEEVNTIPVPVPDDMDIQFEWVSGSYTEECSYVVYDVNGDVIFQGSGVGLSEPVTYHVDCTVSPWRKPSNLAVSEIFSRNAVLSWTENSDPAATAWVVAYKADGAADFTEVNAPENPYTLNGLTPETTYTVKVRPATDEAEKWSKEISFTTDIAAPVPTNVAVSNVTNKAATVSWVSNATSFNVQYKATSAEEWQTTTATENSITITGLTPETEYQVQVQGNYGDLDGLSAWSAAVTFTTDVAFPSPKAVAANHVTATKADISWTGNDDATSYNLRYGATTSAYCDFESVEAWSVDDFAPFTAYDGDGGSTYTIQDVTFTNQGYTGSVITMENGGISESWSAHSGDKFGCFMASSSVKPNNDFFITPEVTITEGCTFSFWARSYTNQYGLERIKVGVYDGNGTFSSYLAGSADGYVEVPTNWTKYSYDLSAYIGQTIQLAINCVSDDAFALFIDDVSINMPPTEWNTPITDITTSSYQLEGLTPETTYVVQVQAVYEGGSSTWTSTNFTTIALDAVPFDLQTADVTATTATLNWDGAQDSYNVRYRKNPVYYFSSFNTNEDLEGWSYSSAIYGLDDTVYNIPGSSNYFLAMGWSTTDEEFIVSPELPAYPSGSTLEFYHYYYSAENTFQIGYSTTTANVDDFTWSDPISSVSAGDAYTAKYSQELPDGVKYIAFRATASDQSHCIFIDDFKIYDSSVSVDEWDETISNVDATTLAITGLDPETEYEWQVQGNLTEGTTAWSTPAFFTTTTDIELANDATDNSAIIADNAGKVANVTLSGRTLYKDNQWNTICLPFDVDLTDTECPLYGATAKTLTNATLEGTHVTLTFGDAVTTLTAGTPYIIKWDGDGTNNIVEPVFNGVTIKNSTEADRTISKDGGNVKFIGYYDAFDITSANDSIYYMTADSKLKATGQNRTLKSCRAYFTFTDNVIISARDFVLDFGDGESTTTGISDAMRLNDNEEIINNNWYDLQGRRVSVSSDSSVPSVLPKGVYIRNGRKVVIK